MGVKASAHSEPRGSLWSTGYQPSAAKSCSPTRYASRTMLLGPRIVPQTAGLLMAALSTIH